MVQPDGFYRSPRSRKHQRPTSLITSMMKNIPGACRCDRCPFRKLLSPMTVRCLQASQLRDNLPTCFAAYSNSFVSFTVHGLTIRCQFTKSLVATPFEAPAMFLTINNTIYRCKKEAARSCREAYCAPLVYCYSYSHLAGNTGWPFFHSGDEVNYPVIYRRLPIPPHLFLAPEFVKDQTQPTE